MLHAALSLAQIAITQSRLRWELLPIAVGIVLLSFGAVAIALFFFRRRSRELTLIYFGLFSILYGFRLLATLQTIRLSFGHGPLFWRYFDWAITSTIVLPFELFLYQIAGDRVKKFLRWFIMIQAILSTLGILGAALGIPLNKLY